MLEVKEVLNSKGQPIVLTDFEAHVAKAKEVEILNAIGFNVPITTMTAIQKKVIEQKFYEIPFADYVPVKVGDAPWADQILTYKSYAVGGDFETGLVNNATGSARLASANAGVEPITVPTIPWAKEITYNVMELAQAARAGNWDLVTAKEKSRKKNWDLGLQKTSFVGLQSNSNFAGLLTISGVTSNTALITKKISAMSASEFNTLVQGLVQAYRANAAYTAMPNRFVIPEDDYNGLAAPTNETYFGGTKLDWLLSVFKTITQNPNFRILPLSYAMKSVNATYTGLNLNRYALYNYDEDTLRMDVPVDYTATLQNTLNGFQYQNVGYGQFTGVVGYRSKEILYFDWS